MKRHLSIAFVGLLALILLSGCAEIATVTPTQTPVVPTETLTSVSKPTIPFTTLTPGITPTRPAPTVTVQKPTAVPTQPPKAAVTTSLAQTDAQGQVTVTVNPTSLASPGDTLVIEVSMNTHSVDLSMDISKLARVSTDSGKSVSAVKWDGPLGGHHVQGKLSFPAVEISGAKQITLTIRNVDVPSRVFTWTVGQ